MVDYVTPDHLGTPRLISSSSGSVFSRHDYQPYGEELFADGEDVRRYWLLGDRFVRLRQKFTSYERDTESGLDFAQARYYGGSYARFTSVDLKMSSAGAEYPGTWNRYAYVANNPLRWVDPSGELAVDNQAVREQGAHGPPTELARRLLQPSKRLVPRTRTWKRTRAESWATITVGCQPLSRHSAPDTIRRHSKDQRTGWAAKRQVCVPGWQGRQDCPILRSER